MGWAENMAADTNDETHGIVESSGTKIATRRTFLKGVAATGAVAAMYTVPKFTSVHAGPAYATTGPGLPTEVDVFENVIMQMILVAPLSAPALPGFPSDIRFQVEVQGPDLSQL